MPPIAAAWKCLIAACGMIRQCRELKPSWSEVTASFFTALRDAHRLDEAAKVADRARERIAEMSEETPEFFRQVSFFYLEVHSVALDRVKATPGGTATAEPEAAAAVNTLRRYAISGSRDPNWMKTDPRTEPLRQRADFKELLAATEQMSEADAAARNTSARPRKSSLPAGNR